jgi:hypothetical protein
VSLPEGSDDFARVKKRGRRSQLAASLSRIAASCTRGVEFIFLPFEMDYRESLKAPLLVLCLVLLLLLLVVAFPPLLRFAFSKIIPEQVIRPDKGIWKEWLAYAKICLEIMVAVAVGGSVFAESVKVATRQALEEYQKVREHVLKRDVKELKGRVRKLTLRYFAVPRWIANSKGIANSLRRYVLGMFIIYNSLRKLYGISMSAPNGLFRFLIWTVSGGFPGGLFGVFAYICFFLLTLTKVIQLYVDSI